MADLGDEGAHAGSPGALDPAVASVTPLPILTPTFETFFRAQHSRAVALAAALVGRGRAEDIAQEAFVRAHREWGVVSSYDRPEAWLRRVVVNLAISANRSRGAEVRALLRLRARPVELVTDAGTVGGDEELWSAVRRLPPRQAAAVALRYVDDLSIVEIAAALGCAEGTAKALLHQGRTRLAQQLQEAVPEESVLQESVLQESVEEGPGDPG